MLKFLVSNSNKIKNFIAIVLYRIRLIPKDFEGKARSLFLREKYNKTFLRSKLEYNKNGYYYLEPMPNLNFLNEYYEKTYWQSRTDMNYPVRLRDIEHFNKIINFYKFFNSKTKKILNFGAGHGGVSFLFHAANHDIYNYDFGATKKNPFNERWHNIQSIEDTNLKFDLIYGSHSLEHVHDINKTLEIFKKISKPDSVYFFEVPNCLNNKIISPPHTYYFTREFFLNKFSKVDYCKTFSGSKEMESEQGDVIRFHTCLA